MTKKVKVKDLVFPDKKINPNTRDIFIYSPLGQKEQYMLLSSDNLKGMFVVPLGEWARVEGEEN